MSVTSVYLKILWFCEHNER